MCEWQTPGRTFFTEPHRRKSAALLHPAVLKPVRCAFFFAKRFAPFIKNQTVPIAAYPALRLRRVAVYHLVRRYGPAYYRTGTHHRVPPDFNAA
jgi:hypothetical protein